MSTASNPSQLITFSSLGTANCSLLESLPRRTFTPGEGAGRSSTYWMYSILAQLGKGITSNFAREAKMVQATQNFQICDTVLLTDEKLPRGLWPLASITGIKTNQWESLVRSIMLKTKSSTIKRPIDKIVLVKEAVDIAEEEQMLSYLYGTSSSKDSALFNLPHFWDFSEVFGDLISLKNLWIQTA